MNREQAKQWFKDTRAEILQELAETGIGKVKILCPLCDAMGEATVTINFEADNDEKADKYFVSYYCAECGFRIDDDGLKMFPPPPPPKHLRHPHRK